MLQNECRTAPTIKKHLTVGLCNAFSKTGITIKGAIEMEGYGDHSPHTTMHSHIQCSLPADFFLYCCFTHALWRM